ncbi:MAG: oligosaccharide flippase family protein [Bacteroidota bacterium]
MALKDQTISAVLWSIFGAAGVQGFGLFFSLWLANLIDPIVFGLFAIPNIFARFAKDAIDVGLGAAIIQGDHISDRLLSTLFWLNMILASFLASVAFFGAPYFAAYTGAETEIVYMLIAPVFIVVGATLTQKAILQKELNFRKISIAEFTSTVAGSLVAIYMAYQSPDVYALVARLAVVTGVTSIVYWLSSSWRPKWVWESKGLKSILHFSLPVFGTNTLAFGAKYFDELLFPKFLSTGLLGVYAKSRDFVNLPVGVIRDQLGRVLFPAFAMIKDDASRMADVYGKAIGAAGVFGLVPISLILLLAPEVIPLFLNEKWLPMIPIAQAMALMLAPSFLVFFSPVLLAQGKSKLNFNVRLITLLIRVLAIFFGLYLAGLNGLLLGLILYGWLTHLIYIYIIAKSLEKHTFWHLRLEMPSLVIHITCLSVAWLISTYVLSGYSLFVIMLTKALFFGATFIFMLFAFKPRGFMVGLRLAKEYHYKFGPLGKFINRL